MTTPDFVPEDDIKMTVCSLRYHKLGYHTDAELFIEPGQGRYYATFWLGEEQREVAWEPAEPEAQRQGVHWAFHNPEAAVFDLMLIDISRREEDAA